MTQLETFEFKIQTSQAEIIYNYDLSTRSQLTCTRTATLPSSLSTPVFAFSHFILAILLPFTFVHSTVVCQSLHGKVFTHTCALNEKYSFQSQNECNQKNTYFFSHATRISAHSQIERIYLLQENRIVF